MGLPTPDQEAWRFTSVKPLQKSVFSAPTGARTPLAAELDRLSMAGAGAHRIVFVNGRLVPELSTTSADGFVVRPLADALAEDGAALESVLGRVALGETNPFTALNAAFLGDGAMVRVSAGRALDRPIHLLFASAPADFAPRVHPRVIVLIGDGAEAVVLEEYVSLSGGEAFTNPVTEIDLGANASLDHYRVQRENERTMHFGEIAVRQGRDSRFTGYSVSLGGRLVRQDIGVTLAGDGSECALNGLYVIAGNQHVDHHTRVDHAASHTVSRELYKGVLDGKATGVFNGWVRIREGVAKIDAAQTNNNLLLSGGALVNTNPELEIFSDDVKATHGATVGQIEDEELFYLRSRGLDLQTARHLLIQGFAGRDAGPHRRDAAARGPGRVREGAVLACRISPSSTRKSSSITTAAPATTGGRKGRIGNPRGTTRSAVTASPCICA